MFHLPIYFKQIGHNKKNENVFNRHILILRYSRIPLLFFMKTCFIASHFSLNHAAIGTLSTSRSSTVLPSFSVLLTCKRAFSTVNERLYSSDRSFPVTTSTLPCKSSSVCFSDNPTERQSLSILRNSASMETTPSPCQ